MRLMNLEESFKEYEMNYVNCIEAHTSVKDFSKESAAYEDISEEVVRNLIRNGYFGDKYFIKLEKKITEMESDEMKGIQYRWFIECRAKVYKTI